MKDRLIAALLWTLDHLNRMETRVRNVFRRKKDRLPVVLVALVVSQLTCCNFFGFNRNGPYALVTGNVGNPVAHTYGGNASILGRAEGVSRGTHSITPVPQDGEIVMQDNQGRMLVIRNLSNPFMAEAWNGIMSLGRYREIGKTARAITSEAGKAVEETADAIVDSQ